jgi:hypothetical protein
VFGGKPIPNYYIRALLRRQCTVTWSRFYNNNNNNNNNNKHAFAGQLNSITHLRALLVLHDLDPVDFLRLPSKARGLFARNFLEGFCYSFFHRFRSFCFISDVTDLEVWSGIGCSKSQIAPSSQEVQAFVGNVLSKGGGLPALCVFDLDHTVSQFVTQLARCVSVRDKTITICVSS